MGQSHSVIRGQPRRLRFKHACSHVRRLSSQLRYAIIVSSISMTRTYITAWWKALSALRIRCDCCLNLSLLEVCNERLCHACKGIVACVMCPHLKYDVMLSSFTSILTLPHISPEVNHDRLFVGTNDSRYNSPHSISGYKIWNDDPSI